MEIIDRDDWVRSKEIPMPFVIVSGPGNPQIGTARYPTCPRCGSDDIKLDALCAWDSRQAEWVLDSDCGECYCEDCDLTVPESTMVWHRAGETT